MFDQKTKKTMIDTTDRMAKMDNPKRKYTHSQIQKVFAETKLNTILFFSVASFPPTRLGIALMLFATTFVMYIIRVNLSVSILGMVRTHKQTENETIKFDLPDVSGNAGCFLLCRLN